MQKLGLLVLIIFTFQAYSQTKNFIDKPYLETSASYEVSVTPDRIHMDITITEKDTKGKISVEELESKMSVMLKSLGIDTNKQLTLSDLTSNFKKYLLKKTDILKNKSYSLVVYDAETAGKVIIALESINISNVNLAKTEYSKLEELKIELKEKAVNKAKLQAESMLKPLNQNLGKAIYISDVKNNISNNYLASRRAANMNIREYAAARAAASNYDSIDIDFEKIWVETQVTVYFAIE